MTSNCKCGARLKRTDIVKDKDGLYRDLDPTTAHWQCQGCGLRYTQRKRQSKYLIRKPAQVEEVKA